MIEAQSLTRRYGAFTAVDGLSFSVGEGEIVGILGPNGAGKTTTIRMVTGFLPPTGGRVTVAGRDLVSEPAAARRELGYLPENVALYTEMRVGEYLDYRARLTGLARSETGDRIAETVDRCLLGDVRNQIIGTLSKGYRQRVGLAAAILHHPKVLILDEPTIGLDPKQIIAIRELIRELAQESTLLLSTHILPEVELLCDRVMIIDRGRIVAEGSPRSLQELWVGTTEVRVELEEPDGDAATVLGSIPGIESVRADAASPRLFHLECASGVDPRADIFRAAVERRWVLVELVQAKASLEDIFVRLTTDDLAGSGGAEGDLEPPPDDPPAAAATVESTPADSEEVPS